jgi:hypothetical protein
MGRHASETLALSFLMSTGILVFAWKFQSERYALIDDSPQTQQLSSSIEDMVSAHGHADGLPRLSVTILFDTQPYAFDGLDLKVHTLLGH